MINFYTHYKSMENVRVNDNQTGVRVITKDNNVYNQVINVTPSGAVDIETLYVNREAQFSGGIYIKGKAFINWDNSAFTFCDNNRLVTTSSQNHIIVADNFQIKHGVQSKHVVKIEVNQDTINLNENVVANICNKRSIILCIQDIFNANTEKGTLFMQRGDTQDLIKRYYAKPRVVFRYKGYIYCIFPIYIDGECVFWKYTGENKKWDRSVEAWPNESAWEKVVSGWNVNTPVIERIGRLPEKLEFQVEELNDDDSSFHINDKFNDALLSVNSREHGHIGMFTKDPKFPLHISNTRGWKDWLVNIDNVEVDVRMAHKSGHGIQVERIIDYQNDKVALIECKKTNNPYFVIRDDGVMGVNYGISEIPMNKEVRFQLKGTGWISEKLIVKNTNIGSIGGSNAYFTHCNMYNASNYALKQTHDGQTHINAHSTQAIRMCINDIEYARLNDKTEDSTFQITPADGNKIGLYIHSCNQNDSILGIHSEKTNPYMAWKRKEQAWSLGIDDNASGRLSLHANVTLNDTDPKLII